MVKNKRFEKSFLKYRNLVIRIVMLKIGDYQTAQEICQQVFVSFYAHIDSVVPGLEKAWLIRAANNAIIDYSRKSSYKNEIVSEMPLQEAGSIVAENSLDVCEDKLVCRELTGRIFREVKSVNERWYEVLMVHCVDGLTHAEAAEKLGISEPVFRARLYRARAYVKKHFGKEYLNL